MQPPGRGTPKNRLNYNLLAESIPVLKELGDKEEAILCFEQWLI